MNSSDPQVVELTPTFSVEVEEIADERPPHVLICVHGIRDDGAWCGLSTITPGRFLDGRIAITCVRYDRLSAWGFLFGRKHNEIQQDVIDQLNYIRSRFSDSLFSILCHSNGSKVVADIIDKISFQIEWIFLCGSVCHRRHIRSLRTINRDVVNDAGIKDWWPVLAEAFRPSVFQATGVFGFHQFPVQDRFFAYKHGDGIRREHIEAWILPTLATGAVQRTELMDVGFKKHIPIYIHRFVYFILPLLIISIAIYEWASR
jgi:hypothetical protein